MIWACSRASATPPAIAPPSATTPANATPPATVPSVPSVPESEEKPLLASSFIWTIKFSTASLTAIVFYPRQIRLGREPGQKLIHKIRVETIYDFGRPRETDRECGV